MPGRGRARRRCGRLAAHLAYCCAGSSSTAPPPNLPTPAARPEGHRLGGVPAVYASRSPPGGELSAAQVGAYVRDGFLFVSGLIEPDVCDAAADAMWAQMGRENRDCGSGKTPLLPSRPGMNRRDVPESWTGDGDWPVEREPAVMAIYTAAYRRAAELLAQAQAAHSVYPLVETPALAEWPPPRALAINRFPRWEGGWRAPDDSPAPASTPTRPSGYAPHADFGWQPESEERHPADWASIRQPVRMQHFVYLEGSGAPGGAGTLIWPRSHRALARAYVEAGEGVRWLGPILPEDTDEAGAPHNKVIVRQAEAEGLTPVEAVAQPGDVLFHDVLCGHCGSANTSAAAPRLAIVSSFEIRGPSTARR